MLNITVPDFPRIDGDPTSAMKLFTSTTVGTAAAHKTYVLPQKAANNYLQTTLTLVNLGSETVALTGSIDGTNFSASLIPIVATTGLLGVAALTNNTYTIPTSWPYSHYKLVKSSTSDTLASNLSAVSIPK